MRRLFASPSHVSLFPTGLRLLTCQLTVLVPPTITPFEFPGQLKSGDMATAVCLASGSPPLTFKWLKDGRQVDLSTATVADSIHFSTIFLKDLQLKDAGNYSCLASNSFGSSSHTSRLSVACESSPLGRKSRSSRASLLLSSCSCLAEETSGRQGGSGWRGSRRVRSDWRTDASRRVEATDRYASSRHPDSPLVTRVPLSRKALPG